MFFEPDSSSSPLNLSSHALWDLLLSILGIIQYNVFRQRVYFLSNSRYLTVLLTILQFPDERLRIKASRVDRIDDEIRLLIDKMFFTMYAEEGIGLAATQVNVHRRLIVVDISETRDQPIALVNPSITEASGFISCEEGCLSIPGIRSNVKRSEKIHVLGFDRNGQPITLEATGLLAVCLQHELDHLDGKLFTDYLSPIKRLRLRNELKNQYKK